MSSQTRPGVSEGSEPPASTQGPSGPTTQEVFDILSNERRRYALYVLHSDGETTIGALADRVAAWENDRAVEDVTAAERKRVYTALQQSHLPKLDRTEFIEFDSDSGRVIPAAPLDDIGRHLGGGDDGDGRPRWRFHLALSGVGVVVALGVLSGVPPFSALPASVWVTVVAGLFAVSAGVHAYRSVGGGSSNELPVGDYP